MRKIVTRQSVLRLYCAIPWGHVLKTLAFALSISVLSAQTADLHVSAIPLSGNTTRALFGKNLPKIYSLAQIDICSSRPDSIAVPLGLVRQNFSRQFPRSGVTVLSNAVAVQIIAHAQGNTKTAIAGRIVFAAAGAAAVATGFSGLTVAWKTGLTSFAVDGPTLWGLFSSVATPATLIGYSDQALPDPIPLAPNGCLAKPAIQLVEGAVSPIEFDVVLPRTTVAATPQKED